MGILINTLVGILIGVGVWVASSFVLELAVDAGILDLTEERVDLYSLGFGLIVLISFTHALIAINVTRIAAVIIAGLVDIKSNLGGNPGKERG